MDLRPPRGKEIEVVLRHEPAMWYGAAAPEHPNDAAYDEIVASVASELGRAQPSGSLVLHDRHLSAAAREVAYQTGVLGFVPPEAVMSFILHSSGTPDMTALHFSAHTNSDDMDLVRDSVRQALQDGPRGSGPLRVGIGEVSTPGGTYTRHISVLVTRRAYELEPAPRRVERKGEWVLRGTLPRGYRDAAASVLHPDGRMGEAEMTVDDRRFELRAMAGDIDGTMYVSITGTDEQGPGKLLQLSVEVGQGPRSRLQVFVPECQSEFASMDDAEEYLCSLIHQDRAQFGLGLLIADPRLSAMARGHSQDMRDSQFFGHLSPSTGLVGDRLARAGYRTTAYAENVARNDCLDEAQSSLMMSVGHRRNILSPDFTHVGVGLASRRQGDEVEWFVTQVFATPVVDLDPAQARDSLLGRINDTRAEKSVGPVVMDAELSAIAQRHAGAVAGGKFEGVTDEVLRDVAHRNARMGVSVAVVYEFARFEPPEDSLDAQVHTVGLGVAQSREDAQGRTGVVVIMVKGAPGPR